MKKADFDAAVVFNSVSLAIYLARIPSSELVNAIYGLTESPGISLPEDAQDPNIVVMNKVDRQRLYYWVSIPPIYMVQNFAKGVAELLSREHGLSVRLVNDMTDEDDNYKRATVLKP